MNATEHAADTLNNLIQICVDGAKGFETAASAAQDPQLKGELSGFSVQRKTFAADLQAAVASMGDAPPTTGGVTAALHRGWINIKAAVSSNDQHAILAECERGEDSAVHAYEKALEADLPDDIQQKVEKQFVAVQATHDRIKSLRDAAKKG